MTTKKTFTETVEDALKPNEDEMRDLQEHGAAREVGVASEEDVARENDSAVLESGAPDRDALPAWAQQAIPEGLQVPPGRALVVLRFRAEWTDRRDKGDRTCVLWNLSVGDEKLANARAGDNGPNNLMEQAKQMIRAVDGLVIDYSGKVKAANLDVWWNEIGCKCRNLVKSHYVHAHNLTMSERLDFLAHCLVARTNLAVG